MNEIRTAILRTLVYSDIFDYPLAKEEIWKFLVSEKPVESDKVKEELKNFPGAIVNHPEGGDFYCLSGREEIIKTRIKRFKESRIKINRAKNITRYLSLIPTVLFVGISGGLAMHNADEKDDIDLFVITSKGSLWVTRLLLVFLLILMGQYRGRGNPPAGGESQKICLNMLIDESFLKFPKERQDLYTAHEIIQLKPLFDRNNTYVKFVNANKWISKFLPNGIEIKKLSNEEIRKNNHNYSIIQLLNYSTKRLQLWYMKSHQTKETIEDHLLAFHPFDYKETVFKEYNKRLKRYGI